MGTRIRTVGLLAAATLAAFAFIACGDDDDDVRGAGMGSDSGRNGGEPSFPVTVEDSSGEAVTFEAAAGRIISLSPGATEVLFALGAGDRVVAVDQFANYPPEVGDLDKLDYTSPAPEPALGLEPDLVIFGSQQEPHVAQFRDLGMTVLLLAEPADLDGIYEQIRLLGEVTGQGSEAEALVTDMQERIAAVAERTAGIEEGPLVLYELTSDGFTVSDASFTGELLTLVKARNVAGGSDSPFPQLSLEAIIDADPEVILLADSGQYGAETLETVRARPGWDVITAVREAAVYEINSDLLNRPGPRIAEGLELLVELLYPEAE